MIGRREFITLLGGAAAWPFAARAQQSAVPVIGFLSTRSRDESARVVSAFQRGLAETGYADGQNVIIEYRWALSQYDRLGALANELVRRPVNLIVAVGAEPSALASKAATATIPIVAIFSTDPVATGLIRAKGLRASPNRRVLNPTLTRAIFRRWIIVVGYASMEISDCAFSMTAPTGGSRSGTRHDDRTGRLM